MHRERLQSLSDEELLKIAHQYNISTGDTLEREFLIDEIYAILVDPFYEQNLSARLLAKRYEFVDEWDFSSASYREQFGIQHAPNEQHLYVALHSPQWLFVDWHVGEHIRLELGQLSKAPTLYLRLYALKKESIGYELLETFDVEIDSFIGSQYLTLPNIQAHYKVILLADLIDRERILLESVTTFMITN